MSSEIQCFDITSFCECVHFRVMFSDNYRGGRYNQPPRGGSYRGRGGGGFGNHQQRYEDGYEANPPYNNSYQPHWNRGGYRGGSQRRDESSNYRFGRSGYRGRSDGSYQSRQGRYTSGRHDFQHQNRGGRNYTSRGGPRNQGRQSRPRGYYRPPHSAGRFGRDSQPHPDPPAFGQSASELPVGLSWHCDLSGHASTVTCVAFGEEPGKVQNTKITKQSIYKLRVFSYFLVELMELLDNGIQTVEL